MENLVKQCSELRTKIKEEERVCNNRVDNAYKELDRLEKKITKHLRKQKKIPATISCRIGKYKVSVPIRFGYNLKIKEV